MPTPFACHWCDKPTLETSGICIKCEQAYEEGNKKIVETVRELESRIRWLEDGLVEIRTEASELANGYQRIRGLVNGILDGEPTTADEHNQDFISYRDPGDENDTMQEDEKLVYEDEHRRED